MTIRDNMGRRVGFDAWHNNLDQRRDAPEVQQPPLEIFAFQDGREFYYTLPNGAEHVYQAKIEVKDFDMEAAKAARQEFVTAMAQFDIKWEQS